MMFFNAFEPCGSGGRRYSVMVEDKVETKRDREIETTSVVTTLDSSSLLVLT